MRNLFLASLALLLGCGSPEPVVVRVVETGWDWAELEWESDGPAWLVLVLWTDPGELLQDPALGLEWGIGLEHWPSVVTDSVSWSLEVEGERIGTAHAKVQRGGSCEPPVRKPPGADVFRCRAEGLPDAPRWLFSAWPANDPELRVASAR